MDSKRSSSFSASKGACPDSISYSNTPRAHQSTEGPYSISWRICGSVLEHTKTALEILTANFEPFHEVLVAKVLPRRLHWGVCVEDGKETFHKSRHIVLVRENLKFKDPYENLAVHRAAFLWGDEACHVNWVSHRLTLQVRCLPVSEEAVWSDGQQPQSLFLRGGVMERGCDWKLHHMNSEDLGCRC